MTDDFAGLVTPLLLHVVQFRERLARGEQPAPAEEKETLQALLRKAREGASRSGELAADFEIAEHALVYWADEVMVLAPWRYAGEYRNSILELDVYDDRRGGELFWDWAEEAERRAGNDPLETFFLCAALGFRGARNFDLPALEEWGRRAYARIRQAEQQRPDKPFDADDPDEGPLGPLPGQRVLLGVSILVALTAVATLVAFLLAAHGSTA